MEMKSSPEVTPQINRFVAEANNYSVLSHHLKAESDRWTDMAKVATEYIRRTEKIIRVLDGTSQHRDLVDYDDKVVDDGAPDVVIYLDKSARPVSWLVNKFWKDIANDKAVKPMIKFLNIDRNDESWKNLEITGSRDDTDKRYDFSRLPKDKILAIRAIYSKKKLSEDTWREEVMDKNDLDGKRILIVDEVKSSGRTLMIAQNLLKLAFKTSNVSGVYFWDSRFDSIIQNGRVVQQMRSVPVWYDNTTVWGRGVGDKNDAYYNFGNRHGIGPRKASFVLSSPHIKPIEKEVVKENGDKVKVIVGFQRQKDELAINLRQDIDQLHIDYLEYIKNNKGLKGRQFE